MTSKVFIALLAGSLAWLGGSSFQEGFSVPQAEAMTAVELTFDQLARGADFVAVVTPVETVSVWEDSDGTRGRRIVTYTRLSIDQLIDGAAPKDAVWVRTLGGTVGNIGQRVEGETVLPSGQQALLFLSRRPDATHAVYGMSQGHYPVSVDSSGPSRKRLSVSPALDVVVPRIGGSIGDASSARAALAGKTIEEAASAIRSARSRNAK